MKINKIIGLLVLMLCCINISYADLTTDNVQYWKLDNNVINQPDATGNSINGTVTGATFISTAKINGGYSFDGSGDYIMSSPPVEINSGEVTMAMWFKKDSTTTKFLIDNLGSSSDSHTSANRFFVEYNANQIRWFTYDSGTVDRELYTTGTLNINTWYHLVLTRDSSNVKKIYINGVLNNSNTYAGDISQGLDWSWGAQKGVTTFDGDIDEISVWSRALSSTEVTELYNSDIGLQYPYIFTPILEVDILSIKANNIILVNNTIFTVNDIIFKTTYNVTNSNLGNFTNITTTQLDNQPNGIYNAQIEVCYNSTCDTSINYTYTINVTDTIDFQTINLTLDPNNSSGRYEELGAIPSLTYLNYSFNGNTDLDVFVRVENIKTNSNINVSLFFPTKLQFITNGLSGSQSFGYSTDGTYQIYLYAENNITNTTTSNYTLIVDTTAPIINHNIPAEIYNYNLTGVLINITDDNPNTCTIQWGTESSINCSLFNAKNFNINGNYTWTINSSDLAGNTEIETGTLLVTPIQSFRFYDNENSLYVTDYTFGDYSSNGTYTQIPLYDLGLGTHSVQFKKIGYSNQNFTFEFTNTSDLNLTFNVSTVKINVYIYYRVNGTLFNKLADILILDLINDTTNNGTITFENSSYDVGTYTIQASSEGYYTEQKVFTYTGEDTVDISLYLLNATGLTSSTLQVNVEDELYNKIPHANTKLLEYDISILGFKEVGQCYTNSIGQCNFLIEVGTKTYIITSQVTIDGTTFTATSTPNGEQFQPQIINGEEVASDLYTRDLTLKIIGTYGIDELNGLQITAPSTSKDTIQSENDSIKTINLPVTWTSTNNLDYTVCLNFYWINNGNKLNFTSPICGTGGSGILTSDDIDLDNSYDYIVDITVLYDGETTIYRTYRYKGVHSLNAILEDLAIVSPIILFVWVGLLSLALWSKKVIVFAAGAFFLSALTVIIFPNYLVGAGVVLIDLIGAGIIYMARIERDLS